MLLNIEVDAFFCCLSSDLRHLSLLEPFLKGSVFIWSPLIINFAKVGFLLLSVHITPSVC